MTPLVENPRDAFRPQPPEVAEVARHYGLSEDAALAWLEYHHARSRYFVNDVYRVQVAACDHDADALHVCVIRHDKGLARDWRHLQQIKNEVAGPEREAVELFPAESRRIDTSNKFHLWVLPTGLRVPFGWNMRDVTFERADP